MSIKCLMNGLEVNYPCSPSCALFGDCVTAFESQKKSKVRTNADRIRAMSDDELAKKLDHILGCPPTGDCENMSKDCKACWLEWLQQQAE